MAEGSLSPGYTFIEYHSRFGPHTMTIPNNQFENPGVAANLLTCEAWDDSSRLWADMVNDLVTEMLPRFAEDVEFDRATAFTKASPSAVSIPIGSITLALAGSADVPGWDNCTQETIIIRDNSAKLSKLVLLDFASGNDFAKYTNAAAIGVNGIVAQMVADTNAWRSRQEGQPTTFVARTATLNEALRQQRRIA